MNHLEENDGADHWRLRRNSNGSAARPCMLACRSWAYQGPTRLIASTCATAAPLLDLGDLGEKRNSTRCEDEAHLHPFALIHQHSIRNLLISDWRVGLDVSVRYASILMSSREQSLEIRTSSQSAPSLTISLAFTSAEGQIDTISISTCNCYYKFISCMRKKEQ